MSIENKVRVTKLLGAGAVGLMDPKVGLVTHKGTITHINDSGRFTVSVSGTGFGSASEYYPHQLFVTEAVAMSPWSYPSGDGSVVFGRSVTWPGGIPDDMVGTGMYMKTANENENGGVLEFSRL